MKKVNKLIGEGLLTAFAASLCCITTPVLALVAGTSGLASTFSWLEQSRKFLGIVTVFAGLSLAFPYYAHIFYLKTEKQVIEVDKSNIRMTLKPTPHQFDFKGKRYMDDVPQMHSFSRFQEDFEVNKQAFKELGWIE